MELLLLLAAAGLFVVSQQDQAQGAGDGKTPATPIDGIPGLPKGSTPTCASLLNGLPPALKTQLDAASKSANPAASMGVAADAMDTAGLHDEADCVRALIKGAAGTPSAKTCDAFLNDVPDSPPQMLRTQVKAALKTGTKSQLQGVATALQALGLSDAAKCVLDVAAGRPDTVAVDCTFDDVSDAAGSVPPSLAVLAPPGMSSARAACKTAFVMARTRADYEALAMVCDSMGATSSAACVRATAATLPAGPLPTLPVPGMFTATLLKP